MQPPPQQQYPPPQYFAVPTQPQPQQPDADAESNAFLNVCAQLTCCVCCTPLGWLVMYVGQGCSFQWCSDDEPEAAALPPPQAPPQAVPMGRVIVPGPQPQPQAPQPVPVALDIDRRGLVSVPVMLR